MDPISFPSAKEWRAWLRANHATASEVVVGFHRVGTGTPSMTWAEAVDEALCYGWIDGIRRKVDDTRYTNRFTPRRPGSNWSAVNIANVERLTAQGRMRAAGLKAFEARTEDRSAIYSYENRHLAKLEPELERRFRRARRAWTWFQQQPPGYRQTVVYWVASAKKPETRQRRLDRLIDDCAAGRRVDAFTSPANRTPRS